MRMANGNQPAKAPVTNKTIADSVVARVAQLVELNQLNLPPDYSPANALRAAYLVLLETTDANKKPVLETCTNESIANALFDMVVQGLSAAKRQGAFIAYGSKLIFQRMYAGTVAIAKRDAGVVEVNANVIYDGDTFQYEVLPNGRTVVSKHEQSIANIDANKIVGAYATVVFKDGSTNTEVMSMAQIRAAWAMNRNTNPTHNKFPDEMAKKTVIGRALKVAINSANDSAVMNDNDIEFEEADATVVTSQAAIAENANVTRVGFDKEPEPVHEPAEPANTEPNF